MDEVIDQPSVKSTPKKPNWESVIKLVTAIASIIFFFGLLINNIFLSSLSLTDYSTLHFRNISIGFMFVIYLLEFMLITLLLIVAINQIINSLRSSHRPLIKILKFLMRLLVWSAILLVTLYLIGVIIGYTLPWGRSLEDAYSSRGMTWEFQRQDYIAALNNLGIAFYNTKALLACGMLLLMSLVFPPRFIEKGISNFFKIELKLFVLSVANLDKPGSPFIDHGLQAFIYKYYILFAVIVVTVLLFSYSTNLYPNIVTNLGGGQPKIVTLYFEQEEFILSTMDIANASVQNDTTQQFYHSDPMLLWYEDSKSAFLTPIEGTTATAEHIVSISSDLIKAKKFHPGYVKIERGSKNIMITDINF